MQYVCMVHIVTTQQESVEAYREQNQFLSAEIIDLKGLRDEDLKTRNELLQ